jgi:hypothetical protein
MREGLILQGVWRWNLELDMAAHNFLRVLRLF